MKIKKIYLVIAAILLILISFVVFKAMERYNKPMVVISSATTYFYIATGSNYEMVVAALSSEGLLADSSFFRRMAELKNYQDRVKPGRYLLKDGMTANELINLLRSGSQEPVKLTFNNIRFLPKLAGIVSKKLELDSARLMDLLTNKEYLDSIGFEPHTVISLFIPNSYEFFLEYKRKANLFKKCVKSI